MAIITPQSEKFLHKYLNNASPTGFEAEGQKLWLDYLKPYIDDWSLDNYGTAYGIINPGKEFRVVIEGHADEISWFVNFISEILIFLKEKNKKLLKLSILILM